MKRMIASGRPLAVGVVVLLAGCVNVSQRLQSELQPYVGHNVKELVTVLGYPGAKSEMMGDTLYTWSVNQRQTLTWPAMSTTRGTVDGAPFTATTYGTEDQTRQLQCTLTIATDGSGTIKNFSFQGNNGCDRFRDALDR